MLVKDGRFGPYATDGETNATLRRTDTPETITIERAAELLADKRAQGPSHQEADGQEGGTAHHQADGEEGRRQEGHREEDSSQEGVI